jgi:hypothetical protein
VEPLHVIIWTTFSCQLFIYKSWTNQSILNADIYATARFQKTGLLHTHVLKLSQLSITATPNFDQQ